MDQAACQTEIENKLLFPSQEFIVHIPNLIVFLPFLPSFVALSVGCQRMAYFFIEKGNISTWKGTAFSLIAPWPVKNKV
jgi:hypothetical protein